MKIKHQLTIFSITTKLLLVLILWFSLPLLIERVVYKHIDNSLLEKKQKFIEHLDKEEINGFLIRKDASEIYASFSNLHNSFLQLYQIKEDKKAKKSFFKNEPRIIEGEENDYRILYFDFTYEKCNYRLEIGNDLSEIEDLIYVIKIFILVVLMASILLTLLTETVFIEYLLKPFNKIITAKIKYSNEPDSFDFTPVQTYSSDFRELDEGLNRMMFRIREVFNNEKQFIANVSHELLTPVALLKNRFENLLQNKSLDDEALDKIASSLKTLDVLKKIINNLLLISRIENNQYHAKETIKSNELISELIDELEDYVLEKNIAVVNNIKESFEITGNKTLLHIMFFNLFVNAIKYTNENGTVSFYDALTDDGYTITIADNGNGMSEEQLSQIFNRFARMDFNQEGSGLGLSIVKSITQFHHIGIKVSSVLKEGSQFVLTFRKN